MWFWIWTLLVLATLAGFVLLILWLWHRLRDLGREASASTDKLESLAESITDRTDARLSQQLSTAPTVADDPIDLLARVEELRAERAERRAAKVRSRQDIHRFWTSIYR